MKNVVFPRPQQHFALRTTPLNLMFTRLHWITFCQAGQSPRPQKWWTQILLLLNYVWNVFPFVLLFCVLLFIVDVHMWFLHARRATHRKHDVFRWCGNRCFIVLYMYLWILTLNFQETRACISKCTWFFNVFVVAIENVNVFCHI